MIEKLYFNNTLISFMMPVAEFRVVGIKIGTGTGNGNGKGIGNGNEYIHIGAGT